MTITQICQQVLDQRSAVQIRFRDGGKGEPKQYDCKPIFTGRNRGWTLLDATTASAVMSVYNALKPESREKFDTIPLTQLINFCWRMCA